jgi:ureidoacrylate peracid hydrolase
MTTDFAERRHHHPLQLDASRAAILVVDMLNDFLEDGGAMVLPEGRTLYQPLNELLGAGRRRGVPVIWVCDEHPSEIDLEFEKRTVHCLRGTWGAEVVAALEPRDDEFRIPKRRYSGFFQTDLDLRLRELGIRHLIVTGVVTNICVRSTVHDAFFLGYDVAVPRECVAATGAREQESTLYDIETHYGTVGSLEQVLLALDAVPATE